MKESINENFKRLASQRMKRIFRTANLLADYQTENNTHVEHKKIDALFTAYEEKERKFEFVLKH